MEENMLIKISAKGLRNKEEGDFFIVVVLKENLKGVEILSLEERNYIIFPILF